jgi:hypothetical protein
VFGDVSSEKGGDGSRENPYKSYENAVSAVDDQGVVVLAGGTHEEQFTVKSGVSVVGGRSAAPEFAVLKSEKTVFDVEWQESRVIEGMFVGAEIAGVDETTRIESVGIRTRPSSAKFHNVGMYVSESSGPIVFKDSWVSSGNAGAGEDGDRGVRGASGSPGEDAPVANNNGSDRFLTSTGGIGGEGGTNNACSATRRGVAGGKGGEGGYERKVGENQFNESDPEPGKRGNGAPVGGSPGTPSSKGGGDGNDGLDGNAGLDGDSSPLRFGVVEGGKFVVLGSGYNGKKGSSGGGGKGGGGSYQTDTCLAGDPYFEPAGSFYTEWGAGGGGGGAGGCGGEGGEGGEPGFASVGVLVDDSTLEVVEGRILSGDGGAGGEGGKGGEGGIGGEGGDGTVQKKSSRCAVVRMPFSSGDGGNGGDGGRGGHGGGGAGGPSVGMLCDGEVEVSVSEDSTIKTGVGGEGGESPGTNGPEGVSMRSRGCE